MAEALKLLGLRLGFVGNRREYLSGWKVNIFKQDEKYKGLKVGRYLILLFIVSFSQRSFKVLLLSFNCKIQQWIESATVDWVFIFRLRHLLEFWVANWLFFPFINEWSFSGLEFYLDVFFDVKKCWKYCEKSCPFVFLSGETVCELSCKVKDKWL